MRPSDPVLWRQVVDDLANALQVAIGKAALGRNLKHLITLLEELQSLGVAFVSLAEGIDATTPAGKLQMHILGAIAEFERGRIRERVMAGLQRARAEGKRLGRPRLHPAVIVVPGGSVREAAKAWGVSKSTAARWISVGLTGTCPFSPRV